MAVDIVQIHPAVKEQRQLKQSQLLYSEYPCSREFKDNH